MNKSKTTNAMAELLTGVAGTCHAASRNAGWWDYATPEGIEVRKAAQIALVHSELSEALEGVRTGGESGKLEGVSLEAEEMADALIRIFDYCGGHEIDIGTAVVRKLAYNETRLDHTQEARKADGGKKL